MSVITSIATAVPQYKHTQINLSEFMCELFEYPEPEKNKLQVMYAKSGIDTRYSVVPDFSIPKEERIFFSKSSNAAAIPTIEQRMAYYSKTALPLCINAIENCIKNKITYSQITHLITVSCTGLSAPGLDIDIVQHLKLSSTINRTSINFMGCYAAMHALKQADYICKSNADAMVLIVCVELCTLHFQKINDADNIAANLLFADGAAAALIVPNSSALKNKWKGLAIKNFHSHIELDGKSDMAWQVSSTGFLMRLSAYIPKWIERGFKKLVEDAIEQLQVKQADIKHWAIHPGGRKIVEVIQKEMELNATDLESSYRVLKNYGNMSSPTFLFVLKDIWDTKIDPTKNELIFGSAFGPGLTMESTILEHV
jgi:predicted naringenin-chalcone synthase